MLSREFNVSKNLAGALYSLPFLISAIISPFLGLMIDRVGKRALFIMSSTFFVATTNILTAILVTNDDPIGEEYPVDWSFLAPLIILGFAYSVYSGALWSSIPYVVKPNTLGTAFGICTAVQNLGLTIVPSIVAYTIKDSADATHPYYGYVEE